MTTEQNRTKSITLSGSDPNNPPLALTYTITVPSAHGTLSGNAPDLAYTPASGYYGSDTFQFTVGNGVATSSPAAVAITIVGPPTANAASVTTAEGTARPITLTGSDPNTPPLTLIYTIATEPVHGTLSGTAPNLVYTPAAGYSGPDSFQFKVNNGALDSNLATVTVTITGQSTPPTDGPMVTSVKRYGFHTMPTTLVLAFDQPLDETTAADVNNYFILDPNGRRIRVGRAVYDPAEQTVTLHPGAQFSIHRPYAMTVMGEGSTALRNIDGQLLDGADTGQPGSNYHLVLTWRQLVLGDVSSGFLSKYHLLHKYPRPGIRADHVAAPRRPSRA